MNIIEDYKDGGRNFAGTNLVPNKKMIKPKKQI